MKAVLHVFAAVLGAGFLVGCNAIPELTLRVADRDLVTRVLPVVEVETPVLVEYVDDDGLLQFITSHGSGETIPVEVRANDGLPVDDQTARAVAEQACRAAGYDGLASDSLVYNGTIGIGPSPFRRVEGCQMSETGT